MTDVPVEIIDLCKTEEDEKSSRQSNSRNARVVCHRSAEVKADSGIATWLRSIGMAQYTEAFEAAEIDMGVLLHLSYLDLKELGVEWQQERQRILKMAAALCADPSETHHDRKRRVAGRPGNGLHAEANPSNLSDRDVGRHVKTSPFPSGRSLRQLKLSDVVQVDGKREAKRACLRPNPLSAFRRDLSPWQSIPGTDFAVDRFKGMGHLRNRHWFLTHFHADHYGGLTASFAKGTIYCSRVTARLCQAKLKISEDRLRPLPLDETVVVAGTQVTLVDANHCPGSVMLIVEGGSGPPVLHTGDARLTREVRDNEAVGRLRSQGCVLVLDTTYCDPKHSFPPQKDVVQYVCDAVLAESFHLKTLFLFGTYGIGKERLFLEVARRAERPVYVSRDKLASMNCLDLGADDRALLTADHEATNLHAIALWKVTAESAQQILTRYGSRYSHVVGFRPTGWSYEKGMEKTRCGRRHTTGKITIHQVPYSEHSSFNEMRDFVQWLQPSRIIPSVGNDEGPKRDRMLSWLRQRPLT